VLPPWRSGAPRFRSIESICACLLQSARSIDWTWCWRYASFWKAVKN
jgi:hypothetical protein